MKHLVDEIQARWEKDGSIIPLRFTFQGKTHQVDSVGRAWRDETGWHILCMAGSTDVFELIFTPNLTWEVRPPAGHTPG
jgi:hypothetical protein